MDDALFEHCNSPNEWQAAIHFITSLPDSAAIVLVFYQSTNSSVTPIVLACCYSATLTVELVQLVITKAKLDSRKRCLLAITTSCGRTALLTATATPPFSSA